MPDQAEQPTPGKIMALHSTDYGGFQCVCAIFPMRPHNNGVSQYF